MSLIRKLAQSCRTKWKAHPKNISGISYIIAKQDQTFDDNEFRFKPLKYVVMLISGYLSYKLYEEYKVIPSVSADATHLLNPGGRKTFNFLADVVEIVEPAVVYIEIKDSRLDFFTGKPITISNGSGFIVKADGLILTNAHVVTNRPRSVVEVKLFNGKTYKGVVEDIDIQSDLATVRIDEKNLPVMKLGNSASLRPGEFVVALGSPLALSNTVTSGVISSTSRGSGELGMPGKDMVYIQTDAAITFGNSGGPLVNLDGEAIGVNSMKVTAGISFAIPSDYVKEFLSNARSKPLEGKSLARRRYMGITMVTLTPQIVNELHQRNNEIPHDVKSGVLIWKVIYGSPAYSSGIRPGDIVTHVDGKIIRSANDIYNILAGTKVTTLQMSVCRTGAKFVVNVTPEDVA